MTGIEFLERGDGPVPGGAAGAADRLRGHPRRHRRDQRRRPRPLPAQAVGSSGGKALSRHRRAAGRLEAGAGAPHPAHQGDRAPLVGTVLAGPRLPGPQRALLHLVHGRRARRRATAAGRRRGRPAAAGRRHRRRRHLGRTERRRAGRHVGPDHHAVAEVLRPDRHRRRARGTGRCRLRRLRGTAHRTHRTHRDRRPGRPKLADRELPRLSGRGFGQPARAAGAEAGGKVRCRAHHRPHGHRPGGQRVCAHRAVRRRRLDRRPRGHRGDRRRLPPAGGNRLRRADRPRRLLRSGHIHSVGVRRTKRSM